MKFLAYSLIIATIISCSSPNNEASVSCGGNSISFANDVKPIINTYCANSSACHGGGSNQGPGALTTYTNIYNNRSQISSSVSSDRMPQGSSLTSDQKNKIICWIQNGASNN